MKLWLISQNENGDYDTYDSAVVAAETESEARNISPGGDFSDEYNSWASSADNVVAKCIGTAAPGTKSGIILGSFNAG